MSVVVRFAERLRSLGAFLEDEIQGIVAGYNALLGVQHKLHTGQHGDITCDSIGANDLTAIAPIVDFSSGQRWLAGPWLLDKIGENTNATINVAGIRPAQITTNQHDYNPPGLSTALMIEVTSDADRNITGIVQNTRQKRLLILGNRGTKIISLIHNSTSSSAAYRFNFATSQDHFLGPNQYTLLYYDTTSQVWRAIAQPEPVYVDAYLSTNSQSINSDTLTKVQFNAEWTDSHGLFDPTTNYRFTASTKGLYWVAGAVMFQPNGTAASVLSTLISKNGTGIVDFKSWASTSPVYVSVPFHRLIPLEAGDYIEIFALQNSGAAMNIFRAYESTYISIFRYGG